MKPLRHVLQSAAILSLFALAACGGGGGGSAAAPPIFDCTGTTEFDWSIDIGGKTYCSYGLGTIGADSAYAKGATGAGAIVAVIDTGIDPNHSELDANISPDSIDIANGGTKSGAAERLPTTAGTARTSPESSRRKRTVLPTTALPLRQQFLRSGPIRQVPPGISTSPISSQR